MVPGSHFDHGGKSPFMDMDLVPIYSTDPDIVTINAAQKKILGLRTEAAVPRPLAPEIRTEGDITYDERNVHDVTVRVNARVSRYYPFHEGLIVRKGQPLFELESPEIYTYIADFLGLQRNAHLVNMVSTDHSHIVQQSLTTLMWRGIPKDSIDEALRTGHASNRVTLRAPITGMVLKRFAVDGSLINAGVKTGQFTTYGTPVARIVDISFVYAEAKLFAGDASRVAPGMTAEVRPQDSTNKVFVSKVTYVYPVLKAGQRFGIARIAIANPDYELKPGMFAEIRILGGEGKSDVLTIPENAVIETSSGQSVFVEVDADHYQHRPVKVGRGAGGWVPVVRGLARGERVVASGAAFFLSAARAGAR